MEAAKNTTSGQATWAPSWFDTVRAEKVRNSTFEMKEASDSFGYRMFNSVLAAVLLVVTFPVLLLCMLLIRLMSSGPAIFTQTRMGFGGRTFKIYKLRTMVLDAEKNGAVWARENDDRIIPMGRFFRKSRLDELPQLWNVLKGDMNMIGPRPERPEFFEPLSAKIPGYRDRLRVKPGITGWAQIHAGYAACEDSSKQKHEYDMYYIRNRSFGLDTQILLKTVTVVATGHGAR